MQNSFNSQMWFFFMCTGSVKLVIKPCQAKKTAEVIDMMVEDLARDDILHVFISDNFCAQSQQVYGRIKTALHEALRKQPIVIDWHSGGSGKPTEKCMWTKDMIVMTVLTGNCRHITTLANKTRLQGLQTVLKDVLKEGIEVDGKKKKMKVKVIVWSTSENVLPCLHISNVSICEEWERPRDRSCTLRMVHVLLTSHSSSDS